MFRLAYNFCIYLGMPYALWRLYRRYGGVGVPWREYFGGGGKQQRQQQDGQAPLVWIHAVSLGEAVAAAPLAHYVQDSGYRLLLTYTTPAGRDWLRQRYPQALIAALPLDVPFAVRRFMRRMRPVAGIIMEAEYWYNLLVIAKECGVRLMLANARLGQKNARRYRYITALMQRMVGCFDIVAAQTARDAGRLRCFGARRATTAGNLKFDLPPPPSEEAERLPRKPALLLAATRRGEERQLLDAAAAQDVFQEAFVVLAPRHPERRGEIAALLASGKIAHQLRSEHRQPAASCQVYVADTLGEMHKWYAACDVAVIGGSFLPYGGQNPIEAMQAGRAVVVGPHMDNYRRLVRRAAAAGALLQAKDAAAALAGVRRLLADSAAADAMQSAARRFMQKCGGAKARHIALVQQLLAERGESRYG